MLNCNKRSITINTKAEKGKEIFRKLLKACDVLVENFGPGALDRQGFTWDAIREINPGMIYASIKGFGPGPRSEVHTSELQSLMRISYAVFCLNKKKQTLNNISYHLILHSPPTVTKHR